jgi:hypothetical protein
MRASEDRLVLVFSVMTSPGLVGCHGDDGYFNPEFYRRAADSQITVAWSW